MEKTAILKIAVPWITLYFVGYWCLFRKAQQILKKKSVIKKNTRNIAMKEIAIFFKKNLFLGSPCICRIFVLSSYSQERLRGNQGTSSSKLRRIEANPI